MENNNNEQMSKEEIKQFDAEVGKPEDIPFGSTPLPNGNLETPNGTEITKSGSVLSVPTEEKPTSMRISKVLLAKLEEEKNTIEGVSSNEEMVEYLLVKHLIFEGKPTSEVANNMKMKVANALELTSNYPLASYHSMRSALLNVISPWMIAHYSQTVQEIQNTINNSNELDESDLGDKIRDNLQEKFDAILEMENINSGFIFECGQEQPENVPEILRH